MEMNFIIASAVNLLLNLFYTLFALWIGVWSIKVIDQNLLKKVNLEEEIQKGNIAAAIFSATLLIFVAIIISAGLRG